MPLITFQIKSRQIKRQLACAFNAVYYILKFTLYELVANTKTALISGDFERKIIHF